MPPPADCCGAHAICEKGLKKIDEKIEYFDDEELDQYRGIPSDSFNDQQIDQFRKSSIRSIPKNYPIGLSVWRNEESNYRMF
ncbi:MAG: hypothetical protein ACLUDU_10860 [Butyricimonas faecihominis]